MNISRSIHDNSCVILSIQPKWCELILNGEKTLEIRKSEPRLKKPFKCYIYCTHGSRSEGLVISESKATLVRGCTDWRTAIPVGGRIGNGMVIGEFACDRVYHFSALTPDETCDISALAVIDGSRMSLKEIAKYEDVGNEPDSRSWNYGVYAWLIKNVRVFSSPVMISDVYRTGVALNRPPQSWYYCEALKA